MFPSNGECTTVADRGVEVGEPQAGHRKGKEKKEKNWKEKEIELLSAYRRTEPVCGMLLMANTLIA